MRLSILLQGEMTIDLIHIDPQFDSKADHKKEVEIKGIGKTTSDGSSFEEKQYGDIWTNDEYLQFMYERLFLLSSLTTKAMSMKTEYIASHLDTNLYTRSLWCSRRTISKIWKK